MVRWEISKSEFKCRSSDLTKAHFCAFKDRRHSTDVTRRNARRQANSDAGKLVPQNYLAN